MYKELRTTAAFKSIPIALISGISEAKNFMEEGFKELIDDDTIALPDGFIEKPVKLPALMQLVEQLME